MRSRRRDYRPELLGVKDEEIRTVRNFLTKANIDMLAGGPPLVVAAPGQLAEHFEGISKIPLRAPREHLETSR